MKKFSRIFFLTAAACTLSPAMAEECSGGGYMNPALIGGKDGALAKNNAVILADFMARAGFTGTVVNAMEIKKLTSKPCWIYGNPVIGLGSGYKPVSINTGSAISPTILLVSNELSKDSEKVVPRDIKTLPPNEQIKVKETLRRASCVGILGGVTTAMVDTANVCKDVSTVDSVRVRGGQEYLITRAGLNWTPTTPIAIIVRARLAQAADMTNVIARYPEEIKRAKTFTMRLEDTSWGYGLYLHPSVSQANVSKVQLQFESLKNPSTSLKSALDIGENYSYEQVSEDNVARMRRLIAKHLP